MKTFTTCAEKKAKQFLNLLQGYTKGIRMTAILILLLMGVSNVWGATQRYIYVGISNHYQTCKDGNQFGLNVWGGTSGGVKSLTWIQDNYNWDGRNYTIYRAYVYDDNNMAEFKAKDDWWEGSFSVTLNGTTKNAIFFSHQNDGWQGQFQQNYQVTSSASLEADKTSALVGENVTLTPSLSSNATYNEIKSTAYKVSTNPNSGGSVSSTGVFSATKAGTYTVTATVTYNPKYFTGITKTATATQTIKVYDTQYVLRGSQTADGDPKGGMAGWGATNNNDYSSATIDGNTMTIVANLTNAKTQYKFKIYNNFDGSYYGQTGSAEIPNNTSWTLDGSNDVKFTTTAAGSYTFIYNTSNKSIKVQYPAAYTVTYSRVPTAAANAPTTSSSINSGDYVLANTPVTFNAKTANTGYTWKGWYDNNAGTGTALSSNQSYTRSITANTTIYACYDLDTYNITYNLNGGSGTMTPTSYTITTTTFNLPAPTKTGHTFAGWYTTSDFSGNKVTQITKGSTGHKEFWAKWTPNTYNITYKDQGGSNFSGTHASSDYPTTHTYGTTTTLATATRTGYTFDGWFTTSDCTGSAVTSLGATAYTADITLYAKWTINTYNITYTAPTHGTFTIQVGSNTPVDANTTADYNTTITLANTPDPGYHFGSWDITPNDVSITNSNTFSMPASNVTIGVTFTANTYKVKFDANGGTGTMSDLPFTYDIAQNLTANVFERTGYYFSGWNTNADGTGTTYTDGESVKNLTAENEGTVTLYAQWTAKEYTVNFVQEGATTSGTNSTTVTYGQAMPNINLPTKNGYAFMGYWDGKDGSGTQYYDAAGGSVRPWDKDIDNTTLYAFFKKAEITSITLDKTLFESGESGYVTVTNHTIEPKPAGTVVVCWTLCYNNGTPVEGHDAIEENGTVKFAIDGLSAGTYKVKASLRLNNCNGEELDTAEATFVVGGSYTVTIKYTCDGDEIAGRKTQEGYPSTPKEATAPEIGGYNFVAWVLGDGIYTTDELTSKTIKYTANYDGYLTATYEKKKLIFLDISTLPNKEKWTAPHIYLYKGAKNDNTGGYWNDQYGAGGATGGNYITHAAMTRVPNTENIWYFDYEQYTNNFNVFVAFTSNNQGNVTHFANCEVIYRADFTSGTPVFVPESNQTAETKNSTAKYYSKGYWVKYMDGTGYWMIIYNADGNEELVRREFTSDTQRMTMTSIVDLEAEHTYKYEIYRNDGYYYNGGDITYTNSSNYKPLNEAEKHTIKTTETGNYTFTLDYSAGDLQIKVQYPVEVGDYRILYTDDVREGRHKPSQIISQNNEEPLVSFFIRPNDNPVLKIQKAMLVTEYEVIWDNVLYLAPDGNWKSDGARFAAYFYNNSGSTWVSMTSINNGEYYGCAIPEGNWPNVIFCRMNPNNHENRWNRDNDGDNKPVWNQTINLTIGQNNQFTITNPWNNNHDKKATGTWSKRNDIIDLSNKLTEKLRELGLTNINAGEGTVFNIHLSNNDGTPTIEKVALYTGNYYIRVDAVDGKWYDYKTNPDNLMTYSAFSESDANSFGDKFSHYKTKWCPRGINVKFVIANDYSLCISDTLARDLVRASGEDYMTEGGELYQEDDGAKDPVYDRYSANIRFMWNRKTNKISRAYLASSSNDSRQFLVLKGCQEIKDENGNNLSGQGDNHGEHRALLQDTQDWIYERTFKVQPGTRVKLYACYADATVIPATAQYFRGKHDDGNCGSAENSVQILGGNGTEWEKIRVIYDFKTNRLMGAWVPSGEISETQTIAADVMIMRNHQEDATCITLAEGKSLDSVKTVYGALRFNRWTLNNKDANSHQPLPLAQQQTIYERGLYFISFPFDVHLSDVFGLGTYGTHWVISTYNGKRRAERGYFAEDCINEDCTNWDYIWDPTGFVMKANEGYLLSLDLELMKDNDESFWPHNINYRELFFPSQVELETITKTNYTMPALSEEYECKINLNTTGKEPEKDRTVKDSYWRCIGVPSFADYSGLLTDSLDKPITWQPNGNELPFLYDWNVTNNNLVVRSATNYRFRPTFAYLIQNGSKINWTLVSTKPNPIIARERSEATSNYEWKIALLRNDAPADHTFIRMTDNESVTSAFDFHQDLAKEFNYGANIYTLVGYERLAANSLPMSDSTTIIPLGVSAQEAGDYTITMPEGVENIGITLVDNETGIHTNLSAGQEYTLTLNKGICENRLFIEVSPIQQSTTDLEYTTEDTREQTTRKMLIDGMLYLIRDGVIYDAQGHKL